MEKIAKITFRPLAGDRDAQIENISELLGMLYRNGQILDDYLLEDYGNEYVARVRVPEEDALDPRYYNRYIRNFLRENETALSWEVVCDDAFSASLCDCATRGALVLSVDSDCESPVLCGDCGREVPLLHLPYLLGEEEHYSLVHFRQTYKSVTDLWIASLSDRFTRRQITDPRSALNREGRSLCRALEEATGTPVYCRIRSNLGSRQTAWQVDTASESCPDCGGALRTLSGEILGAVCDACRLAVE